MSNYVLKTEGDNIQTLLSYFKKYSKRKIHDLSFMFLLHARPTTLKFQIDIKNPLIFQIHKKIIINYLDCILLRPNKNQKH